MEEKTKAEPRRCSQCGSTSGQMKKGYNRSGTQRCLCGRCGVTYTLNPKKREYSEETKTLAFKMFYSGVSGRGVGKILKMSKAYEYVHNGDADH